MTKQQERLFREATEERKERLKMYKSGGFWSVTTMVLVSGILWSAPTVVAKADSIQRVSAVAKKQTAGSSGQATTGNDVVSNSAPAGPNADTATAAADNVQTATDTTATADTATASTQSAATTQPTATSTPAATTTSTAAQAPASSTTVTGTQTPAPTPAPQAAPTADSSNNTGLNNAAAPVADKPVSVTTRTAPTPTTYSAPAAPAVNQITTANLSGTNPANLNSNGSVSTADKTDVSLSDANDIQDNFKAEQIVKDPSGSISTSDVTSTIKDGGVTLVPDSQSTAAGTLVFKNQIDTSQSFTINATFTIQQIQNNGSAQITADGGGLGFILQPVDPQKAGVGAGSDPSVDIGIAGQPNTTFIGRDGYNNPDTTAKTGDTNWDQLIVRQTDNTGSINNTTPTWTSGPSATYSDSDWFHWFGSYKTVPLTEYVTLTWTPQSGVVNHTVTGTMTYTTYSDAARTKPFQTVTTNQTSSAIQSSSQITLNQSVSIAAFGAVGKLAEGSSNSRTVKIENVTSQPAFTAKVSSMPIQINYLDQNGNAIQAPDMTSVNVGDSLTIGQTTDLSTNTFAPRAINGYQFVKAVTSEGTNTLSVMNNVLNALTLNDELNNINIYYTNQVNYTIQPVDAQGQAIAGLAPQQVTSTIGQQVAAPTQDGYTATTANIFAPGSDGSVVKVIYTANKGALTVNYAGLPANVTPATVNVTGNVGTTYNIVTPTVAGYTANLASVQGTFAQGATTLKVQYTASSNSYHVVPVDDTGKAISGLPASTESSITGTPITTPTYAGYTLAPDQTPVTQGGVTSYQLHYTANQYQVAVNYTGLPAGLAQDNQTITGTTGENYQVTTPVVAGYSADHSVITGVFGPDTATNGTFTVNYTADTKGYKVQPVDANQNPISTLTPQQFDGKTGNQIDYPTYDGYTVQPNGEKVPAVSDTMPTINVEYIANPSTVTVSYVGLPADITPADQTQTGVTDGTYQVSAPTIAGYTPDSTMLTGTYSNQGSSARIITYTANDNSYMITPVDENGNVIAGLSQTSGTAKTNATITAPDYSQAGYQLVTGQPALVATPGTNNFQVQYISRIQMVTVDYALPNGQTLNSQVQTGKIGETYNIVSPTITGYTPDTPVITGNYQNQNKIFTVNYAPIDVTVTVQHTGLDSVTAKANPQQTVTGKYGEQFTIPVDNIAGYTPDKTSITGVFSADNGANMYAVKYTGKPATVTINYTGADSNPASVTLTGVVGGNYAQPAPTVANFTPDQASVGGMFTSANATDSKTNTPITVHYTLNSSLVTYTIVPVDSNNHPITGVTGLASTNNYAKAGTTVSTPDYTNLGYVAAQTSVTLSSQKTQSISVLYQKQVSYTMQAVDDANQPIANLPVITAKGIVGSTITPIAVSGYNATGNTYTVPDSATTSANPIQIHYTPKDVAVTVMPVDGNGNQISDLAPITMTQKGGTQLDAANLAQAGYQLKDQSAINVPISDNGVTVALTYLKEVTLGLSGSETETYNGQPQSIDTTQFNVTLPDGSRYALKNSDVQLVPASTDNRVQNVGSFHVQLSETGKAAIANALAQNNVVSFDDTQVGSFVIAPQTLTAVPANTPLIPVNAADPANNPQLTTAIVVQGSTKTYDNDASTDATAFNVLAPSAYTDFTIPTFDASDFNTSGIKQDAGNYQVTLSASGLHKLQAANTNYAFDASNVQSGLFVITPAAITITAPSVTTQYTGSPVTVSTGTVTAQSPMLTATPSYTIAVSGTPQNVGTYTTTVQLTAGANANYKITTVAGKITIAPNTSAAISVDGGTKVYDGTTVNDASQLKVNLSDGLVAPQWNADDFDMSGITSANAGVYSVKLSAKGLADLQAANANYALSADNMTAGLLTVTKAPATISVSNSTHTYSGQQLTTADIPVSVTGTVNGEGLKYSLSGLDDASALNVGNHVISVNVAGTDNPNYDVTTKSGTLTITPATLPAGSVTVNGGTKVYDGTAATDPSSYDVALNSVLKAPTWTADDFDLSGINRQNVGSYEVLLSAQGIADLQAANPNYQVTDSDVTAGEFNITPAPITVTAPTISKAYDGQPYTGTDYTAAVTGVPADGDQPTFNLTNVSGDTGANTYTIHATAGENTSNYAVTYVDGSLTITPNITTNVNVTGVSKTYDGQTAAYAVQLPDGVKAPANWTAADFSLPADATNAGTYNITLSKQGIADLNAANSNYQFNENNVKAGTFTINKATLTATIKDATKVYDGSAFSTDPTSLITVDGLLKNGVAPKFSVNDLSQDINAGTYDMTLTASDSDNPNYDIQVTSGKLTIERAPITGRVTVANTTKTFDNNAANMPAFSITVPTGYNVPDLDATDFNTSNVTSQNVGSYTVTINGSGIDKFNQANTNYLMTADNVKSGTLTITKKDLSITAPTLSKTYDGTAFNGEVKPIITGAVAGADPVFTMTSVTNDVNAGYYDLIVTADAAQNSNYNVNVANGSLTISPKTITDGITISHVEKTYDNNAANVPTFNLAGPTDAADYPNLTVPTLTTADFNTSAAKGQNVGTYNVTLNASGLQKIKAANANYYISANSIQAGSLTINPKTVTNTITISSAEKTYDNNADNVPTFTLAGPTDAADYPNLTVPTLTAADFNTSTAKDQNVGTYDVTLTASGLQKIQDANSNYVISDSSVKAGSLTINPKMVNGAFTISNGEKTYDNNADNVPTFTLTGPTDANDYPGLTTLTLTAEDFNTDDAKSQNVGTYEVTLNASGLQKIKDTNSNYVISDDSVKAGSFTITPKAITITGSTLSKTYDGQAYVGADLTPTVTGVPASASAPVYQVTDMSNDVKAGTYTISVTADPTATANKNYAITTANGELTINKAAVTITAPQGLSKTYDGNGYDVSNLKASVDGQPTNGDTVKYQLSSLTDAVNAGTYSLNVIGTDDNPNYTVNVVPSSFTVTKNDQAAVTLGTATKVYDNDVSTTPAIYAVSLPDGVSAPAQWSADDFELSSDSQNVGTYNVQLSANGLQKLNDANQNYSFTATNVKTGSLTITPAPLTVAAPTISKTYDGTAYDGSYQAQVTGVPTKATAPTFDLTDISQDVNAGSYTLKATTKDATANYTIKYADGTLTINQAPVTITAPTLTKTYDGKPYSGKDEVVAIDGLPANGDGLQYSLTDLSQDTAVKDGGYEIGVTLGDNPNYAVTTHNGSLTINQASLAAGSVAVQDQAKTYDGSAATDATQYTVKLSNQLTAPTWTADDFDLSGITSQNVGSYEVKLSAKGLADLQAANPNYRVSAADVTNGHQIINPAAITVTAPTLSKTYDGQAYAGNQAALTIDGVPADGVQPTFTLTDISSDTDAGTYKLTALNGQNLENYTVNVVDGSLTITPAAIEIAGPTLTKVYDGNSYAGDVTPTITGLPSKGVAPVYSLSALKNDTDAGTYTITVNAPTGENANYKITTKPGQLTISAAPAQFRFEVDAIYRLFGQKPSTDQSVYPVTITGLALNQPQWTPSDFVTSNTSDAVGTYTVNLSEAGWQKLQAANPNYVVAPELATIIPGVMTIAPVSLKAADLGSIQIGSQTKDYDGESQDPTDYQVTLPSQLNAPVWNTNDFQRSDNSEDAGNYSVTLSEAGLTALQEANPNYVIDASNVTAGQLVINKVPVTITAPSGLSKTADGKPYSGTATGVVSGQPVHGTVVVYQLDYGNDGSVGTHTINVIADSKLNPNYDITTVSKSYQILPQPVIVTPSNPVGPTVTDSKKPNDSTETVKVPTNSEQMFKQAVADPVFYYVGRDGQPATSQTMAKVLKRELNSARQMIESSPENAELVVSKQDDTNSKHGSHKSSRTDNLVNDDQGDRRGAQTVRQGNERSTVSSTAQQGTVGSAASSASAATSAAQSRTQDAQTAAVNQQSAANNSQQNATQAELPQTNEQHSSWLAVLGAALMSLLGLLGFKKRKSDR